MKKLMEIFLGALIAALIISYISYKTGQENVITTLEKKLYINVGDKHVMCIVRDLDQLLYTGKSK